MKRPSDISARIWNAVRRIEARGGRPTNHGVRAELQTLYGAGGSFREISPIVEQWRSEIVTKAERRIAAAVAALVELEHDLEREEVARRYRDATGSELPRLTPRQPKKAG